MKTTSEIAQAVLSDLAAVKQEDIPCSQWGARELEIITKAIDVAKSQHKPIVMGAGASVTIYDDGSLFAVDHTEPKTPDFCKPQQPIIKSSLTEAVKDAILHGQGMVQIGAGREQGELVGMMDDTGHVMSIHSYADWGRFDGGKGCENFHGYTRPVYTAPPKRQPLTDFGIWEITLAMALEDGQPSFTFEEFKLESGTTVLLNLFRKIEAAINGGEG